MLRYENGRPAAGAYLAIRPCDHAEGIPAPDGAAAMDSAFYARTDAEGRYRFGSLPPGWYSLSGTGGGLQSFRDSVFLSATARDLQPDTLRALGSLDGIAVVEPNHDPRGITVQVMGTRIYAQAGPDGSFGLKDLAQGRYRLRVVMSGNGYTPLYLQAAVRAGRKDTLPDTLRPVFTGIPVVTGIYARYDEANGVVSLTWGRTRFSRFRGYQVFRNPAADAYPSSGLLAETRDTIFRDTVFRNGFFLDSDLTRFVGPVPILAYRVRVADLSDSAGPFYAPVVVAVAPPPSQLPSFSLSIADARTGGPLPEGSATPGDTVTVTAAFHEPAHKVARMRWYRGSAASPFAESAVEPPAIDGSVPVTLVTGAGSEEIRAEAIDETGYGWGGSATLFVFPDPPELSVGPDTAIPIMGSAHLHGVATDKRGRIAEYAWRIGTGEFIRASGPDTVIASPGSLGPVRCTLRVTDDDGNQVEKSMIVTVSMIWKTAATAFDARFTGRLEGHTAEVFQGSIWTLGGLTADGVAGLWGFERERAAPPARSSTGTDWEWVTDPSFPPRAGHASVVFDGRLWVLGGFAADSSGRRLDRPLHDVWSTADGSAWESATDSGFPAESGFAVIAHGGKLWSIGGLAADGSPAGIWSSRDGAHWDRAVSAHPLPDLQGLSVAEKDGVLYAIGGSAPGTGIMDAKVWRSADGAEWQPIGITPGHGLTGHRAVAYGNYLFVIGGYNHAYIPNGNPFAYGGVVYHEDLWYSIDGIAWDAMPAATESGQAPGYTNFLVFPVAPAHSAHAVFQGRLWNLFGDGPNNFWEAVWYTR